MVATAKKLDETASDQTADQRAVNLQVKTLLGDVRDGILREFKGLEKPWQKMTESEQSRVIHRAADIAERVVRGAIDIAATRGFEHFDVQLGKITVDKTVELKVTAPFSAEIIAALSTRRGDTLVMIARDAGEFRGERKPAKPTNVGELAIPHGEDDFDEEDDQDFDASEAIDPTTGEVIHPEADDDTDLRPTSLRQAEAERASDLECDDDNNVVRDRKRTPAARADEEHLGKVGRGRKGGGAAAQA